MRKKAKRYSLKGILAIAATCMHAATLGGEGTAVAVKTYQGYRYAESDGTWVNDLSRCFKAQDGTTVRVRDIDDGLVRNTITFVCQKLHAG